ncbi:hypothetical protein JHN55_07625 [Streptomyces sp. MBT56]|uniref:hypothetical protein n=1 Tax=unclassified Streptomyces TaxID=2593676 RepID=UPI00190A46BA|nr:MULTISPECIES: hypothetical protein [unclassified Streptomyces]MBK3556404.1 hypothetical protein [Streptomyces sp. MBT56]MBK3606078.1 hypothetical protein [Streptomyces sp. MBT54]MBK3617697.1 hypothetical protein [Streptomyces sp. MBT98]MBK6046609.1 hypothetical protein [Streptomyces sp. MBT55]
MPCRSPHDLGAADGADGRAEVFPPARTTGKDHHQGSPPRITTKDYPRTIKELLRHAH